MANQRTEVWVIQQKPKLPQQNEVTASMHHVRQKHIVEYLQNVVNIYAIPLLGEDVFTEATSYHK